MLASPSSSRSGSSRPTASSRRRPRSATRSTRCRPANLPDTPATREDMAAFKATARSLDQGIGAVLNGFIAMASPRTRCRLHDRPWPRLPEREGDAVRPRHRRDADHARAGRLRGRPRSSTRWSATSTSTRRSASSPASTTRRSCRARRSCRSSTGEVDRAARRDLHRDDLPRRLRAAARGPDRALEVHPALPRLPPPGAGQLRRQRDEGALGRGRLGRPVRRREQLYDLCSTPTRRTTCAQPSPRTPPSSRALRDRLEEWMDATDDPLLDGPVEPPPGAVDNAPTQVSPTTRERRGRAARRPERRSPMTPAALLPRLRDAALGQHPRLPGAQGNRRRRPPRGVLRGAPHSGRPRRPEEYFIGVDDHSIFDHLGERAERRRPPAPLAAVEPGRLRPLPRVGDGAGDDANGVFGGEADVGLLRRLRQPAAQHPRLPRPAARRSSCPRPSRTSPSCGSCGRTRSARRCRSGRRCRRRPGARRTQSEGSR